mmetsp:Transcript_27974/g.80849  ORF Transcript_27974/g.80849 Transcript_27974/m.80849 type:complete len:627 (-) Transcript_27974:62-1942(-)
MPALLSPPIPIRIISATYGPCPGRRLFNGEITGGSDDATSFPYTRNVLPHLTKLLEAEGAEDEGGAGTPDCTASACGSNDKRRKRAPGHRRRRRRVEFPLMDGVSMNVAFGDPCCGTTKVLTIKFAFTDESTQTMSTVAFREHERVVLRRSNLAALAQKETETTSDTKKALVLKNSTIEDESTHAIAESWGLQPATSEIILPLLLPYLEIRRRAKCQSVCKSWRRVIGDVGVATTVDVNDPSFRNRSRTFLRGIMAQSHSSLCSLILNDISDLNKCDLHPALPHLAKLTSLDISRCTKMDNSTLLLISEHLGDRLEVLYIKGLVRVSDEGLVAVCKACHRLRVLEVSTCCQITDQGGKAIGENLTMLEALYMRDNYQLTNESIDCITTRCKKLSLLTLWGCIRLKNLAADCSDDIDGPNLVMLNLWGCHGLTDDVAAATRRLPHLRSLNVAECHNLTDAFITDLTQSSNACSIEHLNLRYLRRLTDISAIAKKMSNVQSIDLSFCTNLSTPMLAYMLEFSPSLTELRLWNCHQIDVTTPRGSGLDQSTIGSADTESGHGTDGRALFNAIKSRSPQKSRFLLLDVRKCIGRHRHYAARQADFCFIQGMANIGFEQKIELFFTRSAMA